MQPIYQQEAVVLLHSLHYIYSIIVTNMRYFFLLVVLGCLAAICNASRSLTRLVILKNPAGKVETYSSNDSLCHKVSANFKGKLNYAAVYGGHTIYYKDTKCQNIAYLDLDGRGLMFTVQNPIQSYRTL
ncbi:hypothetical protein GGI20_002696 [Coemansia sp. BCRC 34301]|nr:hypothetical protein GGI20_002696 [Coemansia sp. BCRC 34301]